MQRYTTVTSRGVCVPDQSSSLVNPEGLETRPGAMRDQELGWAACPTGASDIRHVGTFQIRCATQPLYYLHYEPMSVRKRPDFYPAYVFFPFRKALLACIFDGDTLLQDTATVLWLIFLLLYRINVEGNKAVRHHVQHTIVFRGVVPAPFHTWAVPRIPSLSLDVAGILAFTSGATPPGTKLLWCPPQTRTLRVSRTRSAWGHARRITYPEIPPVLMATERRLSFPLYISHGWRASYMRVQRSKQLSSSDIKGYQVY